MKTNIRPDIISHLKKDEKISILIDYCTLHIHKQPMAVFDDLIRSIVSQQLSTTAAATIYKRFLNAFEKNENISAQILNKTLDELRSLGLSYQKAGYIQNVVRHFDEYRLYETDWNKWSDEDIIHELTKIKGVGKWTVEMILMFSLYREDVLPLDDLIIRNHMISLYDVRSEKKQLISDLTEIAEKWRPYRTYACRYLWAAKDTQFNINKEE
ncbi:MAG: DNA-3-methyladenine glycosylase 2 family protein [Saprospiraceae bacterium]|nr:DNA-3-methyladenine glycosylase 2 family protein [Saprospiraceae bacterium]MBL0100106.1 DNA-3-methyladenine glycosylase 2 family protein [Saprospiraceae bacterium]